MKRWSFTPLIACFVLLFSSSLFAQKPIPKDFSVIAYYTGDSKTIDTYATDQLTHIIFSFCHLKNGELSIDKSIDSLTIKRLVDLKKQNPKLKIMLALGGWGGCEPCSEAFSTLEGRKKFARSVKQVNSYFGTDGIDLDWEYPTIEGHPGHPYGPEDYDNFTSLVKELRKSLGKKHEISFAAGGFQTFLDKSVDWKKVMPLVDRVNIMSYDLVNGYATVTGHHAPLFHQNEKEESTDRAVTYLINKGIPAKKLVIGAAFYARVWKDVENVNNGLYQKGVHTNGADFKKFDTVLTPENGWKYFWDKKASAPYWYNVAEKKFATADDKESAKEKTQYARDKKLGGIMFWELTLDTPTGGMLQAITDAY